MVGGDGTLIALMMLRVRGSQRSGSGRPPVAGVVALVLLLAPLMGCSLFQKNDDYVPDDPADKLYNEGLFLLNSKEDYADRGRRSSTRSTGKIRIRIGRANRC